MIYVPRNPSAAAALAAGLLHIYSYTGRQQQTIYVKNLSVPAGTHGRAAIVYIYIIHIYIYMVTQAGKSKYIIYVKAAGST